MPEDSEKLKLPGMELPEAVKIAALIEEHLTTRSWRHASAWPFRSGQRVERNDVTPLYDVGVTLVLAVGTEDDAKLLSDWIDTFDLVLDGTIQSVLQEKREAKKGSADADN